MLRPAAARLRHRALSDATAHAVLVIPTRSTDAAREVSSTGAINAIMARRPQDQDPLCEGSGTLPVGDSARKQSGLAEMSTLIRSNGSVFSKKDDRGALNERQSAWPTGVRLGRAMVASRRDGNSE